MNKKRLITEINVNNKVVFLRLDLNVPMFNGEIISTKRIDAALPTIKYLIDNNAKIVILSHFGRPTSLDDINSDKYSLKPVAKALSIKLGNSINSIKFLPTSTGPFVEKYVKELKPKSILVLENTRYNDVDFKSGALVNQESQNYSELGKYWASLCDVFVNDAFGAAHRAHASTLGIAQHQPNSAIGFLIQQELENISSLLANPIKPFTIIFGGAKVSEKINAVQAALDIADYVILSGGMVYTFLAALGYNMGKCAVEPQYFTLAKQLYNKYREKILLCTDFLCANNFSNAEPIYKTINDSLEGVVALDVGPQSLEQIKAIVAKSNSILWNGPLGVTEFSNYAKSTNDLCKFLALKTKLGATTIIGGGDSATSAEKVSGDNAFSWISTGGGATLTLLATDNLVSLDPIPNSEVESKVVVVEKVILNSNDINEYIQENNPESAASFQIYANNLYKHNKLINHKTPPANPMDFDLSIKKQLSNKKIAKFDFEVDDPYAVYCQFGYSNPVELSANNTSIQPKKSISFISRTKVIKENAGTTPEELLRLKKLHKKGLSKAGLRIIGLVQSQKHELEVINDIKK